MKKQKQSALLSPIFIKAIAGMLIALAIGNVIFGINFLTLAYPSGEGFRFSQVTMYTVASAITLPLLLLTAWYGAGKGSADQRYSYTILLTLAFYSFSGFLSLIYSRLTQHMAFTESMHYFTPLLPVVITTVVALVVAYILRSSLVSFDRYPSAVQRLFAVAAVSVIAVIIISITPYLDYFNRPESALFVLITNTANLLFFVFIAVSFAALRTRHTAKLYTWFVPCVISLTAFWTYICVESALAIPLRTIRVQPLDISIAEIISPIVAIAVFVVLLYIYKRTAKK